MNSLDCVEYRLDGSAPYKAEVEERASVGMKV